MSIVLDRIKSTLESHSKAIAWLGIVIFIVFLASWALAKGGRWDLYEAIAMADRWPDRFGYTEGVVDLFYPSTPYFPGVSLLAICLTPLGEYQVNVLLLIAIACVPVLHWFLFFVYKKIGGVRTADVYVAFSLSISFFILGPWLSYAKEFKPDTIALCFFVLAFLALTSFDRKPVRYMMIIGAVAMAILFKQQVIAPIVGLLVGHLVSSISLSEKFKDILMILIGLTISAITIFSIKGAFFYAVQSHVGREHISIIDSYHLILALKLLGLFAIGFYVSGKKLIIEKFLNITKLHTYSIPLVIWMLAGIAGAINIGGNIGNTAVGVVLAIPILVLMFDKVKLWAVSIIFIALIFACSILMIRMDWFDAYQKRLAVDAEVSKLIKNGSFRTALITGDSYIAARNAELKQISELDTWVHIHAGINKNQVSKDGNDLLDVIKPDVIVCIQGCDEFNQFNAFTPDKKGYSEILLHSTNVKGILYVRHDQKTNKTY